MLPRKARFEAWGKANPELKKQFDNAMAHPYSAEDLLEGSVPEYPAEGKAATRNSGGEIFNPPRRRRSRTSSCDRQC